METDKLRKKFLDFFRDKRHKIFSSDSLVPLDPTVLFTSAGMNQFKPYFLGEKKDVKRATSCQKCLRTGDLDKVGKTPYHHTFFEMLGNFSFGDYFKKEAIEYAWEFLTSILNIKDEDLWVSVYRDDTESYDIWHKHMSIPKERIVKFGAKDNFWPSNAPEDGPDGPCGPCSEIFFDRGKDKGCGRKECNPSCSCGRFVEIWNLVFTQFNRSGKDNLNPLPQKNIDTGMGLERMAAVLQGKYSNFEIDIFAPLILYIKDVLGIKDTDSSTESIINAIADHLRAVTFAISDGVLPSNEERGYVIRKLIRKALWGGYSLGYKNIFVHKLVGKCTELMGNAYPKILTEENNISDIIRVEEERFMSSLSSAKSQFYVILKEFKKSGKNMLDGKTAFKLYDTYGFPLELTKNLAYENGLDVDEDGFRDMLRLQKESSRRQSMFAETIFTKDDYALDKKTEFSGYSTLSKDATILALFKNKKKVAFLEPEDRGAVLLDNTPFYPESGGQLADKGIIRTQEGEFIVDDVQKSNESILHIGKVSKGKISLTNCRALIDAKRRHALMRAHTATHLLQAALRNILGGHVTQQGSLVDEDKLRFDFSHFSALNSEQLRMVENKVNYFILRSDNVVKKVIDFDEAQKQGALAFFKDKYKNKVRVIFISDYSKELCGGTHVDNTAEIGSFIVLNEFSVSSGIRRIEAVVGNEAIKKSLFYKDKIKDISRELRINEDGIIKAVRKLGETVRFYKNKVDSLEKNILSMRINEILNNYTDYNENRIFISAFENKDYSHLLYIADVIRSKVDNALIFLSSSGNKKDIFVLAVTDKAAKGFNIEEFLALYKNDLGLKGGGRTLVAQGVLLRKPKKEDIENAFIKYLSKEQE